MIRAGIVGIGWWGRTLVESVQGQSQDIQFVSGVARKLTPELSDFAGEHGLHILTSYDELLADPDVDAIVLSTPHSQHVPQTLAAARAGKHVYCEKPLAFSAVEASSVGKAIKASGTCLMVGYNRRFHPEFIKLNDRIRFGGLGTLLHIESTMSFPNALQLKPTQWRAQSAEVPCGGLAPMGVHAIDAMIDLCGNISTVFCQSTRRAVSVETDDTTSILFQMASGMTGYLGLMTATVAGFNLKLYGTEGTVCLQGMTHTSTASSFERRSRLFGRCSFQPLHGAEEVWQADEFDVTRAALEAFAQAATRGSPPPIPLDQLCHGVAVTAAVLRSASTGEPQTVEDVAL